MSSTNNLMNLRDSRRVSRLETGFRHDSTSVVRPRYGYPRRSLGTCLQAFYGFLAGIPVFTEIALKRGVSWEGFGEPQVPQNQIFMRCA
nr:MAG TPA: hypothetical protein [Caudoviricetes sp.]